MGMDAKQLLERMADLEARIAVIYGRFVSRFRDVPDVRGLWESMSAEEIHHAELLSLAAGSTSDLTADTSAVDHLARLEDIVGRCEAEQAEVVHLQDALRVTADLEEAEAEHLHAMLSELGAGAAALMNNRTMEHRSRGLLEHTIRIFGTQALQQRLAWRRFHH
jgi:hypothetical protein